MRKRNNRIVFYLNDEELVALTDKVQKSKFPREKFIRITLANKRLTEMPPVDYRRLVFEMRRAGQNLHRLLAIGGYSDLLERTQGCGAQDPCLLLRVENRTTGEYAFSKSVNHNKSFKTKNEVKGR